MKQPLEAWLLKLWYTKKRRLSALLLSPFSWIFGMIVHLRRHYYQLRKPKPSPLPVIVIGNITVGGTGKTPCAIAIANDLKTRGMHPAILTRGAGGNLPKSTYKIVAHDDHPRVVGDEALLLARHTNCPVIVAKKRVLALEAALKLTPCDVIITDDGLQHYAMPRDIEIVLVDETRQWGNGLLLPAGPLREPLSRLQSVDFVITKTSHDGGNSKMALRYRVKGLKHLRSGKEISCQAFPDKVVHAVAGIANPDAFFTLLQQEGFTIIPHVFNDHADYVKRDLLFEDDKPVIMTEKDAVKCAAFGSDHCWSLQLDYELDAGFLGDLTNVLKTKASN